MWDTVDFSAEPDSGCKPVKYSYKKKYTTLLNIMNEGLCVLERIEARPDETVDFIIVEVNTAFTLQFGIRDLVGKRISRLLAFQTEKWVETLNRAFKEKRPVYFEIKKANDGRILELCACPTDERCVYVIIADITDRKQKEEALKSLHESKESYRAVAKQHQALLNSMGDGFCIFEKKDRRPHEPEDFVVVEANPVFFKQTGMSDLIGNSFRSRVLPSNADKWVCILNEVLRTGKPLMIEQNYSGRDLELHVFVVDDESKRRAAVIIKDITKHKQAENALRESEARLRTVVENSRDGINLVDFATKRFTLMSPAQTEISGFTIDEINNMSYEEANSRIHPDDREEMAEQEQKMISGEETDSIAEYRWKTKSGEYRWVSNNRKLVRDELGQPVAVVGICRDITKRKQREETISILSDIDEELARPMGPQEILSTVGTKLRERLNISSCLYFEMGQEGKTARVDFVWQSQDVPVLPKIFSISDIMYIQLPEAVHAAEPIVVSDTQNDNRTNSTICSSLGIGSFVAVPCRNINNKSFIFTVCTASATTWNKYEVKLFKELTTRISLRIEKARSVIKLRESEIRNSAILSAIPDIMFIQDKEGIYLDYHAADKKLLIVSPQCFIGKSIRDMLPASLAERTLECIQQAQETKLTQKLEYTIRTLGGRKYFEARFTPMDDSRILSIIRNITSRKQAEEALYESEERYRKLAEKLQEADHRKNDFIGILSHEIRNPLAAIKMGLYLLKDRRYKGYAATWEIMDRQVKQLSHLIDDLLDVTRINRNKIKLQKKCVVLNELVQKTVEDYRIYYDEKEVGLEADLPAAPLYIQADEARVVQIIGNLLHNAVKFTHRKGKVYVSLNREKQNAVIRVKDDGIGMTQEVLSNLFQPFMQVNRSVYGNEGGLGLGLALVKGLTELHGGSVSCYSEGLRKGTLFTIQFPLSVESGVNSNNGNDSKLPAHYSRRILIIEDIQDVADSIKSLLENEKHKVMVANTGTDGIRIAKEFCPEILLCDIGLPDMNGYQVAETFSATEELKNVHLISLTGYARPKDFERAQKAGFKLQLAKPVDLETLRKVLA